MEWRISRSQSGMLMCENSSIDISKKTILEKITQKITDKFCAVLGNKIINEKEYYIQLVYKYDRTIEIYSDFVGCYITLNDENEESKLNKIKDLLNLSF